ncbi:MAG TPA: R3H domain-containing nucleic acid-binding protein [bacterium]|jgi:predicted RNA-binding protein Jag
MDTGRRPFRGPRRNEDLDNSNITRIIAEVETKLKDALKPEALTGLNSFERKMIHRHFDHSHEFKTRTYRNGEDYALYIYPVGNLERFAKAKAQECLDSGAEVDLPPMQSFERYIVHNVLKDVPGVATASLGEGEERHIQIVSKKFGRGLKQIVKKIKLF